MPKKKKNSFLLTFKFKKKKNCNEQRLPPEIIRPIVLNLKNDKKSLHSCLLVSRDWCRETVDLLWRQPFHFLYTCNKTNHLIFSKSTNNCHCSGKKRQSQASNLLMTYLSIKYNDELVKEGIIEAKDGNVLFNYLEFLNVLDLNELYSAVEDWVQWINHDTNKLLLTFLNSKFNLNTRPLNIPYLAFTPHLAFEYGIFKFFFTYSPKLHLLSFDTEFTLHKINNSNPCSSFLVKNNKRYTYFRDIIRFINNLLINESKTPEIKQFFTNLTELVFTTKERKPELFSYLSQVCHNVQKLTVMNKINDFIFRYGCGSDSLLIDERNSEIEEQKQLASLIRSQHNLVYFEFSDADAARLIYDINGTNEIFKSLKETQYNSLKTLILNNAFISDNNTFLFYLKHLQNLQELRVNDCVFKKFNDYWEDLWLPNLKYLEIDSVCDGHKISEELSSILLRGSPLINKI